MKYLLPILLMCSCDMGLNQYSLPVEDVQVALGEASAMLAMADMNHDGMISGTEWLVLIQAVNDYVLEMKNND